MSPFEVLGVEPTADEQELKRAYARKVRAHPPETDPEGFQCIVEAFEVLRDPEQRARLVDGLARQSSPGCSTPTLPPVRPMTSSAPTSPSRRSSRMSSSVASRTKSRYGSSPTPAGTRERSRPSRRSWRTGPKTSSRCCSRTRSTAARAMTTARATWWRRRSCSLRTTGGRGSPTRSCSRQPTGSCTRFRR
ncbi:MAG: J domain-containing protein [Myxococcaceae bacterium]|nr:J domain-containing protein [Myxococcaceae bacterium]